MRLAAFSLLFSAVLLGAPKKAEEAARTQFLYLPREGETAVTPAFQFAFSNSYDNIVSGTKTSQTNLTSWSAVLATKHAFANEFVLGVALAYANSKTKTRPVTGGESSITNKGLSDVLFSGEGLLPMTPEVSLIYSLDLLLSLGKSKSGTATDDGNVATGGHGLRPGLAIQGRITPESYLGLHSTFHARFKRETESTGIISNNSGGHILSFAGFYENNLGHVTLNASAGASFIGSTKLNGGVGLDSYVRYNGTLSGYFTAPPATTMILTYGFQIIPGALTNGTGASSILVHSIITGVRLVF